VLVTGRSDVTVLTRVDTVELSRTVDVVTVVVTGSGVVMVLVVPAGIDVVIVEVDNSVVVLFVVSG
jgi:hypothetical protein